MPKAADYSGASYLYFVFFFLHVFETLRSTLLVSRKKSTLSSTK
jgi:hypothetical protein